MSSVVCLVRRSERDEMRGKATARLPFFFEIRFFQNSCKAPLELPFLSILLLRGNVAKKSGARLSA